MERDDRRVVCKVLELDFPFCRPSVVAVCSNRAAESQQKSGNNTRLLLYSFDGIDALGQRSARQRVRSARQISARQF